MHACRFLAQKDGCLWRWWGDWFKRALGNSSIFDVSKVPKTQTEDERLSCLQKWESLIKTTAPNCRGNNLICLPQIWGIWIMGIYGYLPPNANLCRNKALFSGIINQHSPGIFGWISGISWVSGPVLVPGTLEVRCLMNIEKTWPRWTLIATLFLCRVPRFVNVFPGIKHWHVIAGKWAHHFGNIVN